MRSYLSWGLIAGMLTLTGCVSLPSPNETSGGLLAFPMDVRGPGTFHFEPEFVVFNEQTDTEVDRIQVAPASSVNVRTFGPFAPGSYYLGVQTTRARPSRTVSLTYKPNPQKVYFPFEIEEDTITVLATELMVYKRKTTQGYSTSFDTRDLTDEVKAAALADLGDQDSAGLWEIAAP